LRAYEVIFILDPALGDEGVDAAVAAATGVVGGAGGEVQEVQKWGKKRLAYEVKKRREGHYVYFKLKAPAKAVQELERHLKISESALKYLTVVLEVSHRVIGKRKKSAPRPAEATAPEQTAGAQEA
jgi:small subunit ribosomal protein S6